MNLTSPILQGEYVQGEERVWPGPPLYLNQRTAFLSRKGVVVPLSYCE